MLCLTLQGPDSGRITIHTEDSSTVTNVTVVSAVSNSPNRSGHLDMVQYNVEGSRTMGSLKCKHQWITSTLSGSTGNLLIFALTQWLNQNKEMLS